MDAVLQIVLPVFCLIGLGYAAARTGFLAENAGDGLASFVFRVAVPVLLVRSIATAQYGDVNPWAFLLVYGCGVVVAWASAAALIVVIFKRGYRASVIAGVSASFSNLVLMGIPLVERAYGQDGLQILFFLISFHLPVMMTIATFLMEHAVRADGVESAALKPLDVARHLVHNFAVNPIIIGIFAGIIWRVSGVGYGGLVAEVIDLLARTAGPLALFSLGMGLIKYGIKGNLLPAFGLAAIGLLVMPATVFVVGSWVWPLPPLWLKVGLLAASCPTGVNAYLFATYFRIAEGLATNVIVISLIGSVLTVPFWLAMV